MSHFFLFYKRGALDVIGNLKLLLLKCYAKNGENWQTE